MQTIKATYSGLDVNVTIHHNTLLFGDSGLGKTFLLTILSDYFLENDISYAHFDYNDIYFTLDEIKSIASNRDFVLMDSADLYMTPELFSYLKSLNNYKVISLKNIKDLDLTNVDMTLVKFKENSLRTFVIV